MDDSCKGCEEGRSYALRKGVRPCPSSVWRGQRLLVAKELGETSLMFMVHPTLTEENMRYVVEQVKEVISHGKAL